MKKGKIAWIDHMKLFASVMIMTAHFQDAALDACVNPPAQSMVYDILNRILVPFQTGKCWVMVFCILSGYLGCKKVGSFRELVVEALTRWLRFFFPCCCATFTPSCCSKPGTCTMVSTASGLETTGFYTTTPGICAFSM